MLEIIILTSAIGLVAAGAVNLSPIFTIVCVAVGLVVGFLIGLLLVWLLGGGIPADTVLRTMPLWVGALLSAWALGGLFFMLRSKEPNDWRILLAAVQGSTLPGALLGGLFLWQFMRLAPAGPLRVSLAIPLEIARLLNDNPGITELRETLKQQMAQLRQSYPGNEPQLKQLSEEEYAVIVKVNHAIGIVIIYIICSLGFPNKPPDQVEVEVQRFDANSGSELDYSGHILTHWQAKNTLSEIVDEVFAEI